MAAPNSVRNANCVMAALTIKVLSMLGNEIIANCRITAPDDVPYPHSVPRMRFIMKNAPARTSVTKNSHGQEAPTESLIYGEGITCILETEAL